MLKWTEIRFIFDLEMNLLATKENDSESEISSQNRFEIFLNLKNFREERSKKTYGNKMIC